MDDTRFDRLYPSELRFRSWLHWTSVEVAQRVCALLAPCPGSKILDVGSGVGKVCLVGALTTESKWFGVEREPALVGAANGAATQLGVESNAQFILGEMTAVNWSVFDGFYLFNPFAETLFMSGRDPDERRDLYRANIGFVARQLATTEVGTRVVTYHGFGGEMPDCFELAHREPALEDELCLWIRRGRRGRPGGADRDGRVVTDPTEPDLRSDLATSRDHGHHWPGRDRNIASPEGP